MQEPNILFEDADIVVLDKPAGMIVYPDGVHDYPSLEAWLTPRFGYPHFPHRIDRQTSGVLLVARTEQALEKLKGQFKDREVTKVYRAFVYGAILDERGFIDKPIGSGRGGLGPRSTRDPHGTLRDALTAYKVLERRSGPDAATYVEVYPKTGRTHQIRVHFSSIQRPIICDTLYAPSRPPMLGFHRLALHALSLTFVHPATGKQMSITAPLPADFIAAEQKLRSE